MRILIVEDEAIFAMYLEMLLVELGHEVCAVAASARDAVVYASTHCPDVALMDIRLARDSSGIDAARELHSRYGLRCIFLSGNLDEATRNAVLSCEPVAFVGKPILPVQLQRALQKAARPVQSPVK
jgi:two-component system, response regulator PdtaR